MGSGDTIPSEGVGGAQPPLLIHRRYLFSHPPGEFEAEDAEQDAETRAAEINTDIAQLAASAGHKPLMKLIGAGIEQRTKRRQYYAPFRNRLPAV